MNNKLTEEKIAKLDKLYIRKYSEDVNNFMKLYFKGSNIVNECLRNQNGIQNSELKKKYGINSEQFKDMMEK
ncbi:hypothetical protein ALNOE001_21420 [Candidatus Methanobinarius endosymbioticus]|uniref:Uncharacterized protein n=1 Tax=Candidatus Methanobinarius endosymbioticus TaxID=2006182 RepID=A0A366M889_9EURY|nr:hypothetical protein ALNOE001_21420 [Candidatus Methanobinarius endosymbioticus]